MLAALVATPSVAAPLQPEGDVPVASAFLRAERHTGSNFFEEILAFNFKRKAPLGPDAMMTNGTCWRMRLSISAECYVPTDLFSGCETRSPSAQVCCRTSLSVPRQPSRPTLCHCCPSQKSADFCCWKHGVACSSDHYTPKTSVLVFLVRSPYPFLLALHKMPYESRLPSVSFSEFLRRPWSSRPPYYEVEETAANPVALWVNKMRSYRDSPEPKVVVRTSDLFAAEARP